MKRNIWSIVLGFLCLTASIPATAQYQKNVGFLNLCTGFCGSFASMANGTILRGNIPINIMPNGAWDASDVATFELEFFHQGQPEVEFDGTNFATANPLPASVSAVASGGGYTTGGTSDAFGIISGTLLLEFLESPFSDNEAGLIIEIVDENAFYTSKLCLFYATAGCIPGATEVVRIEGQLIFLTDYAIDLDRQSVDFGVVTIGESEQIAVTFTNNDIFAFYFQLVFGSIAPFHYVADTCSLQAVHPLESCSIIVGFEPTIVGRYDDSFTLAPGPSFQTQIFTIAITGDASNPDSDGDGRPDSDDNCTLVPNPAQIDSDGDGYGNDCDADLNNDCSVNFGDLAAFKAAFFPQPYNPDADFNGDALVNFGDLAILKSRFLMPVGPSADPAASCP